MIGRAPVVGLIILASVSALADDAVIVDPNQFQWIREYLEEFSIVSDGAGSGPRDIMTTRLEPHPEAGRAVLSYRRASYSGATSASLETQQFIQYTLTLDRLDAASVSVQSWSGFNADATYWLVRVAPREGDDFVSYTNVFERRLEDSSVDVTSSRGRVREVVLGYFTTEAMASRLAENFRDMIARAKGDPSDVQPDVAH